MFGGRHDTTRLNDLHMLDMSDFVWTKWVQHILCGLCSSMFTIGHSVCLDLLCVVCAHLCSPWVIGCVMIYCVWSVLIYVHHGSLGVSWSSVCGLCSSMFTMGHWVCRDLLCVVCAHLRSPWVIGCVMIFCVWSVLIYVHHGSLGVSWSTVCGLCSSTLCFKKKFTLLLFAITKSDVDRFQ